jgi:hypothetical protein
VSDRVFRFCVASIVGIALLAVIITALRTQTPNENNPSPAPESPWTDVPGGGRVQTVCVDGVRIVIGDHEQQGYGIAAVIDPRCPLS